MLLGLEDLERGRNKVFIHQKVVACYAVRDAMDLILLSHVLGKREEESRASLRSAQIMSRLLLSGSNRYIRRIML